MVTFGRVVRPGLAVSWAVLLAGCSGLLGIQERRLRTQSVDGGPSSTGGGGGGGAVATGGGGSRPIGTGGSAGALPAEGGPPTVCQVTGVPGCADCLCASCDAALVDVCSSGECGPVVQCVAASRCASPSACADPTACGAMFQGFAQGPALLDCMKLCPVCAATPSVCTAGNPCSTGMGKAGVCQGGSCVPCSGIAGTFDPACNAAYGQAFACCAADGACSGCPAPAVCAKDGDPCGSAPGVPNGKGICLAGQCVQCSGTGGAIDNTCMVNVGGTSLCCSPTHQCESCPPAGGCTPATDGKACAGAVGDGICSGGYCKPCPNPGVSDPTCLAAYGPAKGCCNTTGSCSACSTKTCVGVACPAGYVCSGGACGLCSLRGQVDPACQAAYGAMDACCSATGICSPCPSAPLAACGDSILQAGEACDDGNPTSGDGCSSACQVEAGYACDMGAGSPCRKMLCIPKTCAQVGANCGVGIGDGCGGFTGPCGSGCVMPDRCGGGGVASTCGAGTCLPRTCQALGVNCGPEGDGCGARIECGTCAAPQTCGGAGIHGQCG